MENPRLFASVAITALAIVGTLLWSNRNTTSGSQALGTLGSGVAQAAEGTREVEIQTPNPSREPIEQPGKADEPDTEDTADPVPTREETWLAKYSAMDSKSLFQITRDKRIEYFAFSSEEVERYIASGMATSVPPDELTAKASTDRDTMSVMTVDRQGDSFVLSLRRSDSPELFDLRDETEWLGHYVMGVNPLGNVVQDNITIRRGEVDGD